MLNHRLKDQILSHVIPSVQGPAQYIGGELNSVVKDHRDVKGKLCLCFPDTYTIGMSHHGLQVLYTLMNGRDDWCCERAFTPWVDMEERLKQNGLPLYGLETFTPLHDFDVVGFSLQYEICYTNILTMLDLGGIPLFSQERTLDDPLIIAGGPCAQNPEPVAEFVDVVVTGDGEPSLPALCDLWLALKGSFENGGRGLSREASRQARHEILIEIARRIPYAYVPSLFEPIYADDGSFRRLEPTVDGISSTIEPCTIDDLDAIPLPLAPIVPFVECVHDRIAIEIMRGCPWQCRFCQSTVIKRPLRFRSVETIVQAALESHRRTGYSEVSLLSLSTSDYPEFDRLVRSMQQALYPLGVKISLPSLRVTDQLQHVVAMMATDRRGLTLAPEVARDDMREQIRKPVKNEDLYNGCREAFKRGWQQVKLYFLCGLPGERNVDLDGIIEMSETIARIGKEERGRSVKVTASVSNFVPKAHTPYQWNGMQTREYFDWAHQYLRRRKRLGSVHVKCHATQTSLLEGMLSRGDRRTATGIELAWRRGARLDSWSERLDPALWWKALADAGIDSQRVLHRPFELMDRLPWDHLNVKKGRAYLEKEQRRSELQLADMANAV